MPLNKNALSQYIINTSLSLKKEGITNLRPNGAFRKVNDNMISSSLLKNNDFNKSLQKFSNDKDLNKSYSKFTIVMKFMNLLQDFFINEDRQMLNKNIEMIDLERERFIEYKFYVPIRGIDSVEGAIEISKFVRIVNINKDNANQFMHVDELTDYYMPYSLEYTIQCVDHIKGMEIAIETSRIITNFLRFIDHHTWNEENLEIHVPGYGFTLEALRVTAVKNQKTKDQYTINNLHKNENDEALIIDEDFIQDLNDHGLDKFGKIIDGFIEERNDDLDKQILRGIVLFGDSKIETDDTMRLLKLMLVVECLLNAGKNEPVTATLSDNMAFILEENYENRELVSRRMRDIYQQRSEIVHNGLSTISPDILLELEQYVGMLLYKFLVEQKFSQLKTRNELKSTINKMKYS
ncbi:HEPN domain-containing protein [Peribacillus frigoritolerans]|uniref:HEPN domain-containing protein n=1 Tax=Peribacillus frigoritolerans TaxID=450367 RepID=UPI001EFC5B7C|nr:HEPN domain-containing protein [Peribacillus frigoritolerans]ULM98797.1 HEPN domain-containing protein [Peribacillus frigoritolerans]